MSAVSCRKQPRLADCEVMRLLTCVEGRRAVGEQVVQPGLALLGQHLHERGGVGQVLAQLGRDGGDRIEGGRRVGEQLGELLLVGDELLGEGRARIDERAQVAGLALQRRGQLADQLVEVVGRDGLEQPGGRGDDGADVGRHLVRRAGTLAPLCEVRARCRRAWAPG